MRDGKALWRFENVEAGRMADIEEMHGKFDNSPCAVHFGMKLVEISPGYARVKLELKREFLNWENMIQGGVIATLLDQAFGCACNTLDNIHVAIQINIHFLAAASVGETIYAESRVLHAGRRVGASEMTVVDSNGKTIARATGTTVSMGARS
jgi:acyl-CoA thioesterase